MSKNKFIKPTFTRKPYNKFLYKWSPDTTRLKNNTTNESGLPTFCEAPAFSQGEDWVTTYTYQFSVINGIQHQGAYVECDYVQ